jgi:DUF971 family protein
MPIPLDPRKQPTSIKVMVTTGEGVAIVWADGHESRYTFSYLRETCPCAMCNDERKRKARGGAATAVLPMYKAKVTAKGASPVGNYALQFEFSDSHATGIYSYGHLREICPCDECAREFRSATPNSTLA